VNPANTIFSHASWLTNTSTNASIKTVGFKLHITFLIMFTHYTVQMKITNQLYFNSSSQVYFGLCQNNTACIPW